MESGLKDALALKYAILHTSLLLSILVRRRSAADHPRRYLLHSNETEKDHAGERYELFVCFSGQIIRRSTVDLHQHAG